MDTPSQRSNWNCYDVPEIAAMLVDNCGDDWDHVLAWLSLYEAIDACQALLTVARAELADAWPSEHSSASAMFLNLIDEIQEALTETADVAFANSKARSSFIESVEAARRSMTVIQDQWVSEVASAPNTPRKSITIGQLNNIAHQAMKDVDRSAFDCYRQLRQPVPLSLQPGLSNRIQIPVANGEGSDTTEFLSRPGHLATPDPEPTSEHEPLFPRTEKSLKSLNPVEPGLVIGAALIAARTVPRHSINQAENSNDDSTANRAGIRQNDPTRPSSPVVDPAVPESRPLPTQGGAFSGPMTPAIRSTSRNARRRRQLTDTFVKSPRRAVPPILKPQHPDPPIYDPGPGIIGLNRQIRKHD
jgi:hypothetical protein